ncbi:MAG: phage tail protein [Bacillota bacterium]
MDQYIGEIRMFAGNFPPQGWAFCNGQLLSISENDVLFALIGTTYGGDGQTTFALPDLRGRIPLHRGTNPSNQMGQKGGVETVTLAATELPAHTHTVLASSATGEASSPENNLWAKNYSQFSTGNPDGVMNPAIIQGTGGSIPHDNMMPFIAINFIIALEGLWPNQN